MVKFCPCSLFLNMSFAFCGLFHRCSCELIIYVQHVYLHSGFIIQALFLFFFSGGRGGVHILYHPVGVMLDSVGKTSGMFVHT